MSEEWEIPWYGIDAVYKYFGYVNRRAALRAIRVGRFPVPTYQLRPRKVVVDRKVFHDFFQQNQQEGLEQLENCL